MDNLAGKTIAGTFCHAPRPGVLEILKDALVTLDGAGAIAEVIRTADWRHDAVRSGGRRRRDAGHAAGGNTRPARLCRSPRPRAAISAARQGARRAARGLAAALHLPARGALRRPRLRRAEATRRWSATCSPTARRRRSISRRSTRKRRGSWSISASPRAARLRRQGRDGPSRGVPGLLSRPIGASRPRRDRSHSSTMSAAIPAIAAWSSRW